MNLCLNISKLQTPNATNVAKGFPKAQIGTEDFPRNRGRLDLLADLIILVGKAILWLHNHCETRNHCQRNLAQGSVLVGSALSYDRKKVPVRLASVI